MNKKGFTLVEIIAAIVLMAMLSTILITVIVKRINNAKDTAYNTLIRSIELSAQEYANNNEGILSSYAQYDWIKIPLSTLVENNYFDKSLINPKTKEPLLISDKVYVTRDYRGNIISIYNVNQNSEASVTLIGAFNVYLKKGDTFVDPGVTATTAEGINVSELVSKTGTVNTAVVGVYVLTYTYESISITRNVIVGNDFNVSTSWHTLTVNPNGGTFNGSTSNTIYSLKEGRNQSVSNISNTDGVFNGWNVTCANGCTDYGMNSETKVFTMGSGNATLTAQWIMNPSLTVNLNGGSTTQTFNARYAPSATITLVTPTKSGSIFTGWTASGTGSSVNGSTLTMGTSATTLTANWLAYANMFTYDGNKTIVEDSSGNWRIKLLTSGTFTPLINMNVDIFLVGGGGGGANSPNGNIGGGGGGGGRTATVVSSLSAGTPYSVTVGAGGGAVSSGGNTYFGTYGVVGGNGGSSSNGGAGGSGGANGSYGSIAIGGSNGANGATGDGGTGGTGQGTTTYEFGNSALTLYSGGGGGGGGQYYTSGSAGGVGGGAAGGAKYNNGGTAVANTGGGGGGAGADNYSKTGGTGGSGIVVVRNHR